MRTKYVVVDTSAFIRNTPLHDIGEHMVTVADVISEVKNKRQLRHLSALPYDLEVKDVFIESIQHVTEFSKKTGDFPSLSATDIKVLALTYELEKQYVGTNHLRNVPVVNKTTDYTKKSFISPTDIAGFYLPSKSKKIYKKPAVKNEEIIVEKVAEELSKLTCASNLNTFEADSDADSFDEFESAVADVCELRDFDDDDGDLWYDLNDNCVTDHPVLHEINVNNDRSKNEDYVDDNGVNSNTVGILANKISEGNNGQDKIVGDYEKAKNDANDSDIDNEDEIDYNNSSNEDDSDDEHNHLENSNNTSESDVEDENSWITPRNFHRVKTELNPCHFEEKSVTVGCITTDFAMQNVLKQMGLNVIALDGRVIKEMRTFILRCYACFKTTSIMKKTFCPSCGNKTLKRVAVSLDSDGKQRIHINLKRPLSTRGKRFALPMPKGGKHAVNPRLVEDARRPHQRPSRLARTKTDALHPDYTAGVSPFAIRDVHSRSAQLGFTRGKPVYKNWMQRNPNEPKRTNSKKR